MRMEVSAVPLIHVILYTFKSDSISLRVLSSMFPDRYEDEGVAQGKINWLDFVATMANLGLSAEHRGGSLLPSKGESDFQYNLRDTATTYFKKKALKTTREVSMFIGLTQVAKWDQSCFRV